MAAKGIVVLPWVFLVQGINSFEVVRNCDGTKRLEMVGLAFKIQRRMGKAFVMSQPNHMRAAKVWACDACTQSASQLNAGSGSKAPNSLKRGLRSRMGKDYMS